MSAFVKAPWSLRGYAALTIGTAIELFGVFGSRAGTGVVTAVCVSVMLCNGSRAVWWILVVANILALLASPFVFPQPWLAVGVTVVSLACLLAPESRRHVLNQTD